MESFEKESGGEPYDVFGFSLRSLLLILLGIALFSLYVGVLLFGENSLSVLESVKKERRDLMAEKSRLQRENQQLQKKYFELLQIVGDSSPKN